MGVFGDLHTMNFCGVVSWILSRKLVVLLSLWTLPWSVYGLKDLDDFHSELHLWLTFLIHRSWFSLSLVISGRDPLVLKNFSVMTMRLRFLSLLSLLSDFSFTSTQLSSLYFLVRFSLVRARGIELTLLQALLEYEFCIWFLYLRFSLFTRWFITEVDDWH